MMRGYFAIVVGLLCVFVLGLAFPRWNAPRIEYGVTFSQPYAQGIGLDWKQVYDDVLSDLGVRHLRLVAYWSDIEMRQGEYDFSSLDYQVEEARKYDADIVLALGRKVPRWPECFIPELYESLSPEDQDQALFDFIGATASRYEDSVVMWQLENEPFLDFGICPPSDGALLRKEEQFLRSITSLPIMVTDSGELSTWLTTSSYGDVLGTTMYRTVFSKRTQRPFSYDYIFPAWLYRLKSRVVGLVRGKTVLISELQGEPWGNKWLLDMTDEERAQSFSPERFVDIANFAQRTQLPRAYWWGVEYWYWEKEVNGDNSYWETGKQLFREY